MSESAKIWKEKLAERIPPEWGREIDIFETEIALKKQGKIEDKIFAERRLRRGAYGQRYDNGKRHDGKEDRKIPYPRDLTKGLNTVWDAPGMQRIKIPWGGITPEQMDVIADLAEEYSDAVCHVTTRQDFQFHSIHIEDCPAILRRLAAVGITTQEACGNSVRNITACYLAGVCNRELFDVTPYAEAAFRYLLGHPDIQDFGRKFKIAFSGCREGPCGLVKMHDLGFIASKKIIGGKEKRGFETWVGGGLGPVPYQAKLLEEFLPEDKFLALTQAVCRVYARLGEKKNRNRSRIKFLVHDMGIEKFRQAVLEERAKLPVDPRWISFLTGLEKTAETLPDCAGRKKSPPNDGEFLKWRARNVIPQKQNGLDIVMVVLPLGDITSNQLRSLSDIASKYVKNAVRTTVEQNIVLRFVEDGNLYDHFSDLKKINLADPFFGTIADVTSCPGTDTCKLGISSSRGLAGVLRERLAQKGFDRDEAVSNLKIKVSGCFNSCGQHHIADIGFYGVSRKIGNYLVPHFQLVLGGEAKNNAGSYGLAVGSIPSKAVPQTVERLTETYVKNRLHGESFQSFIQRLGKVELKKMLADLAEVPPHDEDPSFYMDWGSVREFTTSDIGKGECAGEVVSLVEFGLTAADRELFEAQVALDADDHKKAARLAFHSMIQAAHGLIKGQNPDIPDKTDAVVGEFKSRFCDTGIFYDPFVGPSFANYFLKVDESSLGAYDAERSRKLIEEARLFIDAAYSCHARMS